MKNLIHTPLQRGEARSPNLIGLAQYLSCPLGPIVLVLLTFHIPAAAQNSTQLRLLPDEKPQCVFAGEPQTLSLRWRNPGGQPGTAEIRAKIFEATTAVAAPFREAPWKNLTVLPGQTVVESATLAFPLIRAETRFLVQWLTESDHVVGTTEVLAYPPDLLPGLKPLLDGTALGVFDPMNRLQPLLKKAAIESSDLEDVGLDHFEGKLAILGPFGSSSQMRDGFAKNVKALARNGVGVVWMQPPMKNRQRLEPSFYIVREGRGAVVVVQHELLVGLSESPEPQLTLLELCRLAAKPESLRLPGDPAEP